MSGLFGSGTPKGGFQLQGGGSEAPWNWGVSPFDQSAIDSATGSNVSSTESRYNQLGLGGSTMEGQDVAQDQTAGTAMTGQEQTQNVSNAALRTWRGERKEVAIISAAVGSSIKAWRLTKWKVERLSRNAVST